MTYASTSEAIDALSIEIGEAVYLDIAKWHLYLGDAKLAKPLAEQLYVLIDDNRLSEANVNDVLQKMMVPIGSGRQQIPLIELLPKTCQRDLMDLLDTFQDKL